MAFMIPTLNAAAPSNEQQQDTGRAAPTYMTPVAPVRQKKTCCPSTLICLQRSLPSS